MSINLAGPAYRVTVPACFVVAALRKKLKAEQEARQKAKQARLKAEQKAKQARLKAEQKAKQARLKAEQKANETKIWYLAIIFLVVLAILAIFFIKKGHPSSNNPNNSPKSGVKKLKKP